MNKTALLKKVESNLKMYQDFLVSLKKQKKSPVKGKKAKNK